MLKLSLVSLLFLTSCSALTRYLPATTREVTRLENRVSLIEDRESRITEDEWTKIIGGIAASGLSILGVCRVLIKKNLSTSPNQT